MSDKQNVKTFYNDSAKNYIKIYQRPVQHYTEDREHELLSRLVKDGDRVLDVGCGIGRLTKYISGLTSETVYGFDYSQKMVEKAREANPGHNIVYVQDDAENIKSDELRGRKFDVIISVTSLNNVPNIDKAFQNLTALMADDGIMVLEVINSLEAARPWRWIYLFPYFVARAIGLWPANFSRFYSRRYIENLAAKNGLGIKSYRGLRFIPDWFPMVPFNTWTTLAPFMLGLFRALRPLDEALATKSPTSSFSRFHWFVLGRG